MASANSRYGRYELIASFALYFAVSVLLFGRGLSGRFTTAYIGIDSDPRMFMWYLRWWRYALEHRINPFVTDLLWAPLGFNLAWTTFIPLPAWLVIPIGRTLGENAAYNVLCLVALPAAAAAAFLLCRHVTRSFWPSILGGYIFGFSPYMLGHMMAGHLHLILAFPIPLAVLAGLRRLDCEISARRFTLEIAGLLVVQFLCGIELFATMTLFAGFALFVAFVFFDKARAGVLNLIGPPLAAAYAIAVVVVSPYIYFLFALGFPHDPIWPPSRFTADLLNFFIPTKANLLGVLGGTQAITDKFSGVIFEDGAYIGIPLIILIEAYRRTAWRTVAGRFLILILAISVVASFGPALHVAGRALFPMPWALFAVLPVISNALAARFAMYASLVISLIVAIWFSSAPVRSSIKYLAAALVFLSFAPNPSASFWVSILDIPAFFTNGSYAKQLSPGEIILPLPFGQKGDCMYWQSRSDMYFKMAGGWTGSAPFEFARMPVMNYFYGGIDLPEAGDQLRAYLAHFEVDAVIADPTDLHFPIWDKTLASIGLAPTSEQGVSIYKIPQGSLDAYAKLSGARVEARADALRFDTIVVAAAKYASGGNDPARISPFELKRQNLLPSDWLIDTSPHAYTDWQIAPAPGGRVGIIVVGSYEGVRPLIERYRATASEIEYPAPTRWTADSHPRLDVIKPLLVTFDAAHLIDAARSLQTSPPPERTTPFLAGVTAGL
jgi:hypothetical protein